MPHRSWKHTCNNGGGSVCMNTPVCEHCGEAGEYDGCHYSMYEQMARYQSCYGMKPMGLHRTMVREQFQGLVVDCGACDGRGLLDHPAGYSVCSGCKGIGRVFTVPPEVVAAIRQKVLDAFPDAAAEQVSGFPGGVVYHDLSTGLIKGYSLRELDEAVGEEEGDADDDEGRRM